MSISPVIGRLADRLGPSPVLLGAAVAHATALAGLALTANRGSALPLICTMTVTAGATYPPLAPAIRGVCNRLTEAGTGRARLRGTVLAADTALYELVFVIGPLLVGVFGVVSTPASAIAEAAAVTLAGISVRACGAAMRAQRPHASHVRTNGLGPLRLSAPGWPARCSRCGDWVPDWAASDTEPGRRVRPCPGSSRGCSAACR
ncbi:hypothetical protein [Streptomyces ipomoeae]|uniref:hypothetical protein n=1 Tax=Streptomyces ipomoeae TaxID=103232 RepID=UPI001C669263|nr:hypothetical protein [Streptomyces ipomoeae]